jgi:hypothetical protein
VVEGEQADLRLEVPKTRIDAVVEIHGIRVV